MSEWIDNLSNQLQDPLRRRLLKSLQERMTEWLQGGDPRFTLRPLPHSDWLCPFCATHVKAPHWDGREPTLLGDNDVLMHLDACPAIKVGFKQPQMLPWNALVNVLINIRVRHWANYRVGNVDGHWICPYCIGDTGIIRYHWDGTEANLDWFLPEALRHLEGCAEFKNNPMFAHSQHEILSKHESHELVRKLRERVEREPVFQVFDDTGNWIDPFEMKPVEPINQFRTAWGEGLQEQIVEQLLNAAHPGRASQWRTDITVEELHRIAGKESITRLLNKNLHGGLVPQDGGTIDLEALGLRMPVSAQAPPRTVAAPAARAQISGAVELETTAEQAPAGLRRDMAAARELQLQILPSQPPQVPGYEVSAFYDACEMLAGDLFQFTDPAPGFTGFFIADVAGHGLDAALMMAMAMKTFSLHARGRTSPAEVLNTVCHDIARDLPKGKFITALYAILHQESGELRYARAGHNPAFLAEPARGRAQPLQAGGMALGVGSPELFASRLSEGTAQLAPGAAVLFYTDGLVEAHSPEGIAFGEGRLCSTFLKRSPQRSRLIIEGIVDELRQHVASDQNQDDLTLIVLKRH